MNANPTGRPKTTSTALAERWHQSMTAASFSGQGAGFWDAWVHSLPPKREHSSYTKEVLRRIKCNPSDTILDVGAGTGALSLPLAKRVHLVTALDQSEAMLQTIAQDAAAEQLNNIKLLHLDWTKARLGIDFDQHDIVLVSRSLPAGEDILRCLELISHTAKKRCYITWKVNGYNLLEAALCAQLGTTYHPFPDYTILRDIIISLGITPRVDIFATCGKRIFGSLEQAYTQIIRGYAASETERQASMQFLADNLEYQNGYYVQPMESLWALISWSCA